MGRGIGSRGDNKLVVDACLVLSEGVAKQPSGTNTSVQLLVPSSAIPSATGGAVWKSLNVLAMLDSTSDLMQLRIPSYKSLHGGTRPGVLVEHASRKLEAS